MATSPAEIDALLSRKAVTRRDLQQLTPADAPVIMDIFLHDQTPWNDRKRRTALQALGVIGDEQAVELLRSVVENPAVEMRLREAAVRSLAEAHDATAFSYLELMAQHPDFSFRKSAIVALADAAAPNTRRVLEHVQTTDPDERMRQRAAALLAALQPVRALYTTAQQRPGGYIKCNLDSDYA
jgi:hypothetical protein